MIVITAIHRHAVEMVITSGSRIARHSLQKGGHSVSAYYIIAVSVVHGTIVLHVILHAL
jgi:hypothetical protein